MYLAAHCSVSESPEQCRNLISVEKTSGNVSSSVLLAQHWIHASASVYGAFGNFEFHTFFCVKVDSVWGEA